MFALYRKIVRVTKWKCGEDVFGPDNIPNLSERCGEKSIVTNWLTQLDVQLSERHVVDKSKVLEDISLERWVAWLTAIRQQVLGTPQA